MSFGYVENPSPESVLNIDLSGEAAALLPVEGGPPEEFKWPKGWQLFLATVSVGFSFTFAALGGFPNSLFWGIFFAFWSDCANILFQANAFEAMSQNREAQSDGVALLSLTRQTRCPRVCQPPCRKWWGLPFSLIGNTPLIIAAWQGIDLYITSNDGRYVLRGLSIIGAVAESFISVRGAGELRGVLKDLWEQRVQHPVAFYLAVILGNLTAVGFSINGVGSIQQALKRFLPDNTHSTIDSPYLYAALWVPNLYPFAFGSTFGMDGFFALFAKVFPGIFSSFAESSLEVKLGLLIAAVVVGLSVGPSVGMALASGIDGGALSIFSAIGIGSSIGTNLAPLTIKAGLQVVENMRKCCCQRNKKGAVNAAPFMLLGASSNSDSRQTSPEFAAE